MKLFLLNLALLLLLNFSVSGQTHYTVKSGNWHSTSTWASGVPASGIVVIQKGHTVIIDKETFFNGSLDVYGIIEFEKPKGSGKGALILPGGSVIQLYAGSSFVVASGGAGSNYLQIGTSWINGAKIANIQVPNTLTAGNLTSGGACPSGCGSDPTPLPVKIASFSASKGFDGINLFWESSSELNFSHYHIEHSTDGLNFKLVGEIEGVGSESGSATYQFVHPNPNIGFNYYQLVAIDVDGSREVHGIRSVKLGARFTLYPNPAHQTDVYLSLNAQQETRISLMNNAGSLLYSLIVKQDQVTLPTAQLSPGLYLIRLITDEVQQVERLVIK